MDSQKHEFERTWQPRLWISLGVLILIVAYLIAFVVGNSDETSINFVFAEATTSLIWVILLSALAGVIGGVLLSQLHYRRQARIGEAEISEASVETPESISDGDA
jgi:uncharacterized integral membrane protein